MSGHNKWSQIKRTKGASDAKKSQLFGKLARLISSAVKVANGDRTAATVRAAIEKARAAQDVRHILSKNGFALGSIGSVLWAFQKDPSANSGQAMLIPTTTVSLSDEDAELLEKLVDDLEANEDVQEVITNAE